MRLAVIGAPFNSGGGNGGVAGAPRRLRQAGLVERLRADASDAAEWGDVTFTPPDNVRDTTSQLIAPESLAEMVVALQQAVASSLSDRRFPLVLGGDCPVLLGCLAGARDIHGRVGLLFVDGHEDAWPPTTSTTGEAADMELGLALGRHVDRLPRSLRDLVPVVRPSDVTLLGPRDQQELATAGVASLHPEVDLYDDVAVAAHPAQIAATAASRLSSTVGAWWLHVDLDVLATDALAAVDYPQPGGLDWSTLERLTRAALSVPGVVGWDVTIYNPDLDPDGACATRIIEYIAGSLALDQLEISSAFRSRPTT